MEIGSFLSELKRRRVFRVAAVYAAVAFVVWQAADIAFPALQLPAWLITAVVALTVLGFPVALVLAWAYDITPEGVVRTDAADARTEAVAETSARPAFRTQRLAALGGISILALAAGAFLVFGGSLQRASLAAAEIDRSIAVLPFENLSADPENAFFASGIHDEIMSQLAKISDLNVVARSSVLHYREGDRDLREIGALLGVGAILEGSVQRAGNRVRVSVHLIDPRTRQTLWAERYERDLTDVFAIQNAVAQEIAAALKANLTAGERARLAARPTENAEAYDYYLRGRDYENRYWEREDYENATTMYERAVAADPSFALAWAKLAEMHAGQRWNAFDTTAARLEKARYAAERAHTLAPNLPEVRAGQGWYHYHARRDYERALEEFRAAAAGMPGNADVVAAIGFVARRQGEWGEAIASMGRAVQLNPRDATLFLELGNTYAALRRYPEAIRTLDRAIDLAPDLWSAATNRGWVYFDWQGTLDTLRATVVRLPPDRAAELRYQLALLERDRDGAVRAAASLPDEIRSGGDGVFPRSLRIALAERMAGNERAARVAFDSARMVVEPLARASPEAERLHGAMAIAYAGLGRKDQAIASANRAVELLPEALDAYAGPRTARLRASVLAWVGEEELALNEIERLLRAPGGLDLHDLRVDPVWDPLRRHPRFHRLLRVGGAV